MTLQEVLDAKARVETLIQAQLREFQLLTGLTPLSVNFSYNRTLDGRAYIVGTKLEVRL